jgi:hypothetical protein
MCDRDIRAHAFAISLRDPRAGARRLLEERVVHGDVEVQRHAWRRDRQGVLVRRA